jgi:hypothetical protein
MIFQDNFHDKKHPMNYYTVQYAIMSYNYEDMIKSSYEVLLTNYPYIIFMSMVALIIHERVKYTREISSLVSKLSASEDEVARVKSANHLIRRSIKLLREKHERLKSETEKLNENTSSLESRMMELNVMPRKIQRMKEEIESLTDKNNRYRDDVESGISMAITSLSGSRTRAARDAIEILKNILGNLEDETPAPDSDSDEVVLVRRKRPRSSTTPTKVYIDNEENDE